MLLATYIAEHSESGDFHRVCQCPQKFKICHLCILEKEQIFHCIASFLQKWGETIQKLFQLEKSRVREQPKERIEMFVFACVATHHSNFFVGVDPCVEIYAVFCFKQKFSILLNISRFMNIVSKYIVNMSSGKQPERIEEKQHSCSGKCKSLCVMV